MADFTPGPVHNAMRRMTELIDLENFDSYFDEMLLEASSHGNTDNKPTEKEFDTLSEDLPPQPIPTVSTDRRRSQAHVVTIKSYTEIFYERKQGDKEISVDASSKAKSKCQEDTTTSAQAQRSDVTQPKRQKKISTASRVSNKTTLEKNAWGRIDHSHAISQYNKEDKSRGDLLFKFFFGINGEYKWYSLKGKGFCWILPMLLMYVILCILLLPVMIAAAIVSAILLCASVCSYLSLATKKVGVSIEEEGDKSCLEALWWWA